MRKLEDIIAAMPAKSRARAEKRAKELIKAETLRQLRTMAKKTQQEVASRAGIAQNNVSRLEGRDDMLVSTLTDYVGALGGKLHLVAELPGIDGAVELDFGRKAPSAGKRKRAQVYA